MRKIIYLCDQCSKDLENKSHISLPIGHSAGIAISPDLMKSWRLKTIPQNIYHFCSPKCIADFFKEAMKKADGNKE